MLGIPDTRQVVKLAERAIDALERIATALEAQGQGELCGRSATVCDTHGGAL
ncbi:hypothetical protein SEA_ABINGHOST_90 [Mycobacterium phage Abinghost]|uniref:Uncharacterized protein n=2 Tax=Pipefishvirus TaxID=1982899 RepID=A0A514TY67_9CAUD|nr:hypothetical protein KNU70_gp092 [Mycobacterium phage Obutu]AWY03806.1 hypothetical protein MORTCELLUS_90 [Mycobacterium phage Mortcellus]AXH68296.1 hypothetical protein SEA_TYDOLLA_86 [Mycobacterium phage Tydolla]QGH76130.1 hypothetical protein SEA_ABINGHOST_90 [Mycobacterium phage Abinghost]UDG78946.1 hypothetical protein SEA_LESTYG_88 [Mycobacterium phage LestyG]QDK01620.1 hypothetical protein OBUTU_92 [Mycobacterium phage Obutu]